ncbi:hypothetical protein M878_02805 [Streptomyces roseochromogenus subsp. oscitans DS 12.976]|uniref:Regulatory protein n=1 Tax=Streptomyces roseochromogenus subsp. oscitans DS 12.976 TaxID=1352936 RepID=V6KVW4_STRRC|nr:hypothetical protein M878_02805 [Streptomyces roseochromogenus subsp. oscitans DS 12.976]
MTSQYVSQVTNDLEHNVKEQERITDEIAALQDQLAALQHDHTILVSMQEALGVVTSVGAPATTSEAPVVPAPRTQSPTASDTTSGTVSRTRRVPKKATEEQPEPKKRSAKKPAAAKPAAKKAAGQTAQPTLVELVRRHLAEQQEPRSAAEVSEALGKAHPDREIQTKVIRTTLENLVARNSAQRTKQGSSVFYTLSNASDPAPATAERSQPGAGE